MKKFKLLLKFMKGTLTSYGAAIILIFASTATALLNPLIIKVTIDSVLSDTPPDLPGFLLGWLMALVHCH